MMKKITSSLFAVVLLTAFAAQASKHCCAKLVGVAGGVAVDTNNSVLTLPYSPTNAVSLPSTDPAFPFNLSVAKGCGFTLSDGCLTIRPLDAFSGVAFSASGVNYNSFSEILVQFRVNFDTPFKNVPAVTALLDIINRSGSGCPFVGGGTEVSDPTGAPLGYINETFIFVSDVTTTGFTLNFDAQVALVSPAAVTAVAQGLIALGVSFDFHAIATQS